MKKIILIAALVLVSLVSNAQHMTFQKIDMGLPLDSFSEKLIEKGYTYLRSDTSDDKMYMHAYKGVFAGYSCNLIVVSSTDGLAIGKVAIFFDKLDSWAKLKSEYLKIQEVYKKKYGDPEYETNNFESPYFEGDGYEVKAVENDQCQYLTYWLIDKNSIILRISSVGRIEAKYIDSKNMEIIRNKRKQLSIDEI